jgi:fatty-acyl-CoA synthase
MELEANWLGRLAQSQPHRPAVFWRQQWVSYAELYQRAQHLAGVLAGLGVKPGDRVGVLAHNHLGYLEAYFAAPLLGFVPTFYNHRLSQSELQELVAYTRPQVLLLGPGLNAWPQHPQTLALDEVEHQPAMFYPPFRPQLEDPALMLFTGGTTGLPKAAVLSYRQLLINAMQTSMAWGLRPEDRYIVATPMFHAALNALATPLLYLGGSVLIQEKFDPVQYLDWTAAHQISLLFMVPTMFQMLAAQPQFAATDFSRARWAISGGAPCPHPVRQAFAERGIRFKQGYGLTECGVNCFTLDLEEAAQYPESVGRPMPHLWARLVGETGQEANEVGELWLAGPVVMKGYFERPDETARSLVDWDGRTWLRTGDLAQRDAEGRYHIVGRAKEMFISGGENVFPVEVERALYDHPAVAECAVLGVPDARWGEVGLAAVVCKPDQGIAAADLAHFLRQRLAAYKVPKRFVFLEELPKSGPGKILKTELAQLYGRLYAQD